MLKLESGGVHLMETMKPEQELSASRQFIERQLSQELGFSLRQVQAVIKLLDEGNTIPFIARYRKEMTGELNENQLREIEERLRYLRGLEERKREVLRLIGEQGKLTDQLRQAIEQAAKLQEVEDLYRPYRQKRKTRASAAKEKGLAPLAEWVMNQPRQGSVMAEAAKYVNAEKEVASAEDALAGAMDIIAEQIADDAAIRAWIRTFTLERGMIVTEAKDPEQESVYEMYYAYQEAVRKIPPHRILAINRGEREEVLKVRIEVPVEQVFQHMAGKVLRGPSIVREMLQSVIEDAYKRLIAPSIEREVRNLLTEKAEDHAIEIFAQNLRSLLLQPPVKGKTVLGVDPAYRTGCKVAVVDETGKLLEVAVTYPTPPHEDIRGAEAKFTELIEKYDIDTIVIGNGTASRETEQFVAALIAKLTDRKVQYMVISEAGASVYSASKLAQEEFPELDAAERSAISIARRLQDPLAELVKIDPKSIGVGQYQHDVSPKRLEDSLRAVVESAVNYVGVDVNTASPSLLSYVSGIQAPIAKNIVKHREANGKFRNREQLKQVPRLGAKTFEQCAGFLRISDGDNPLDNTPIHPESYAVVDQLFRELNFTLQDIGTPEFKQKLKNLQPEQFAGKLQVGLPTLKDIWGSLLRPGRDPRDELPKPIFRTDILKIEDLQPGMELTGTVRNVIDFGAFVDIGVKHDGLVHISELSDKYVKHPLDVVSVGDTVRVRVLQVDAKKGRISLTMRGMEYQ
jgi:uncharacterized protein